jgi:hypothetical protein
MNCRSMRTAESIYRKKQSMYVEGVCDGAPASHLSAFVGDRHGDLSRRTTYATYTDGTFTWLIRRDRNC